MTLSIVWKIVVMVARGVDFVTLKRRIDIIANELRKRGKEIKIARVYYLKVDDNHYEKINGEYELYERLMKEWEES